MYGCDFRGVKFDRVKLPDDPDLFLLTRRSQLLAAADRLEGRDDPHGIVRSTLVHADRWFDVGGEVLVNVRDLGPAKELAREILSNVGTPANKIVSGDSVSSIASFWVIRKSLLPDLVHGARSSTGRAPISFGFAAQSTEPTSAESVYKILVQHGRDLGAVFPWSGYVMLYLLTYLAELGVDLGHSQYDAESDAINASYDLTYLITPNHRTYLPQLQPSRHNEAALEDHFKKWSGLRRGRKGRTGGLALLSEQISSLVDDEILLVHIG